MLSNADIVDLTTFRRHLHRHPEVSGEEVRTAAEIAAALRGLSPARLINGLGGHGVAAVFEGMAPGPTVLFRAELDALPIRDESGADWASQIPGKGHQCGHDGHSAILLGLARLLSRRAPARGRAVMLFQPAEEDGSGAAAVIADPRFAEIRPDWAFALHNMPGYPLGAVVVEPGPANCASRGLKVTLSGHTSHAATPHLALSPAAPLARLIPAVMAAGPGGEDLRPGFRLVTVTHTRMGEPAFGITPGEAELWLTLRTLEDADMAALIDEVMGLVEAEAAATGLRAAFEQSDVFHACTNEPEATAHLIAAAKSEGFARAQSLGPMRASEDFGLFGSRAGAKAAMFLLGSGENCPPLHNPDYDFPDELIAPGLRVFDRVLRDLLG